MLTTNWIQKDVLVYRLQLILHLHYTPCINARVDTDIGTVHTSRISIKSLETCFWCPKVHMMKQSRWLMGRCSWVSRGCCETWHALYGTDTTQKVKCYDIPGGIQSTSSRAMFQLLAGQIPVSILHISIKPHAVI